MSRKSRGKKINFIFPSVAVQMSGFLSFFIILKN
uniref:Uncharacterized protein n=1 Tax=Anguilla anguilla TaxID=7936 RepID=A0A0E9WE83_ANGAN